MILTEKEAEKKSCCDGGYGTVVTVGDEGKYSCIASKCMAWRQAFDADGHYTLKQVAPPSECPDCKGTGTIRDDTDTDDVPCASCDGEGKIGRYEHMGYCGLAGRPGSSS
jgi:DnaJ-class molecular chaperone